MRLFWKLHARGSKWAYVFSGNDYFAPAYITKWRIRLGLPTLKTRDILKQEGIYVLPNDGNSQNPEA
jgi:hypothetical protein